LKVTVAGAGMAGLVAAARLRELGHEPRVHEKGTRPGGSMLLSSCVVWRHVEWKRFRAECPGGDEQLQRLIWERLDEGLSWLESLGAEPVWRDTENPLTIGRRYDPHTLTRLLLDAAGEVELESRLEDAAEPPVLLATGGFAARLACERGLLLRANPWSEGDGLDFALARGAAATPGMDEFYGRVMPAPPVRVGEEDFVPLAQLYGREARVFTDDWREITPPQVAWHENDLAQLIGRRAW
jgi:fumarate reductase flavoprotein subunit